MAQGGKWGGPLMHEGDVQATFSEVDGLRDQPADESVNLGPWALAWGVLGIAIALLLHGFWFFVIGVVLWALASGAWLLCRRRARAGLRQSQALAWIGLLLAQLSLVAAVAGVTGHALFGWGWSWIVL
jgi:hypothetical protein